MSDVRMNRKFPLVLVGLTHSIIDFGGKTLPEGGGEKLGKGERAGTRCVGSLEE